jgi:membrane associated rhomboid family serine protease
MPTVFDRYDPSVPPIGAGGVPPVVRNLLIANVAIGLLALIFGRVGGMAVAVEAAYEWLQLDVQGWRELFPLVPVWQLVTYGFLHDPGDFWHLLLNMLGLYFFGSMLEQIVGSRRMLVFFLASIVVGGIAHLVQALALGSPIPVVGASGGVLFLVVAMAVLRPRTLVIFFFVPVQLWIIASIYGAMALFGVLTSGGGGGTAHMVHLAGAAFGFAAAKLGWLWYDPVEALEKRRAEKVIQDRHGDEERLDRLLERIHKDGIGSLSASEREFLRRMSARRGG